MASSRSAQDGPGTSRGTALPIRHLRRNCGSARSRSAPFRRPGALSRPFSPALSFPQRSRAAVRLPSLRASSGAMAGEAASPPLKVLAAQLRAAGRGAGGTWRLSRTETGRAPLCLRAVWMQGTVLQVERGGGGSARLRDGSGHFTVLGVEDVPRGRPCLSAGTASAGSFPLLPLIK